MFFSFGKTPFMVINVLQNTKVLIFSRSIDCKIYENCILSRLKLKSSYNVLLLENRKINVKTKPLTHKVTEHSRYSKQF